MPAGVPSLWPMASPPGFLSRLSVVAVALGVIVGSATTTFATAKGWSYLTDDPSACVNCHIMQDVYDGWLHGSHREVATCNDCHVPHDFTGKWTAKAVSGARHGYAFTTDDFVEPIRIHPDGRVAVEDNCRRCHGDVGHALDAFDGALPSRDPMACTHCHRSVGHETLR